MRNIHNSLISPGQHNNCQDSIIIDNWHDQVCFLSTRLEERESSKKKKGSIFHSLDFIAIST